MMRIIVEGDKSRYQFLRKIIDRNNLNVDFTTEDLASRTIRVVSDKNRLGDGIYYSACVPLHTELVFPDEFEISPVSAEPGDRVMLFDEFPYRMWNEKEKQDSYLTKYDISLCEIILLKNERKALSSDISTEETALEEARENYEKEGFQVKVLGREDKMNFLLWSHGREIPNWDERFSRKLCSARTEIEEELDFDYEISFFCGMGEGEGINKILSDPQKLDSFTKYNPYMNGKNVIELYTDNAYDFFWKSNASIFEGFNSGIYKKYMKKVCLWNMEKDLEQLNREVMKSFKAYVKGSDELTFSGSEEEYSLFVNQNAGVILSFKERIKKFFQEEMRNVIKKQMLDRIRTMEGLVDEKIF